MGGCRQDQVLSDTEWPLAVPTARCADDDGATRRARRSEGSLIRRAVRRLFRLTDHAGVTRSSRDERTRHWWTSWDISHQSPPPCLRETGVSGTSPPAMQPTW